jgi:hypothetical protein
MGKRFVLAMLLVGLVAVLGGCSSDSCSCHGAESVAFFLKCSPNDLVSVVATGPCADPEAGLTWYIGTGTGRLVSVSAATAGTCHIVLTFATGFTYSQDVTFVVSDDCSGCPSFTAPTTTPFTVNNPDDTCVALPTDAGPTDATAGG